MCRKSDSTCTIKYSLQFCGVSFSYTISSQCHVILVHVPPSSSSRCWKGTRTVPFCANSWGISCHVLVAVWYDAGWCQVICVNLLITIFVHQSYIHFWRHANILEDDWSDGDLVYVSSLCFADILLQGIFLRAQKLKPGSILLTSKVPEGFENSFSVVKSVWCKVSWGRTKIFVLIRKDDDEK